VTLQAVRVAAGDSARGLQNVDRSPELASVTATHAAHDASSASVVDVVIVSFNSREHLRGCVEPLLAANELRIIVVDNASTDEGLKTLAGLDLTVIQLASNCGFAYGCNVGWRSGKSPFVLFLNPDARMDGSAILRLARVLRERSGVGAVAPKILNADGSLAFSLRFFPRLRSTYARALLLHRLFPRAAWTDEVIRDPRAYERSCTVDWASGASLLVRRSALEALEGLDQGFFMYCEDKDLCRRLWARGFEVWYEPESVCAHEGGASGPRSSLLPVAAASRIRYARKHMGPVSGALERAGLVLDALRHLVTARGGWRARAGRLRALGVLLLPGTERARNIP